jgi:ADP-dependent NAD(P)H-hydrate dehydratase / NAD(P)H-hydrate epimerase
VIEAFSVADVRIAEEAAMADLPDGELMARAARGLAAVVVARLEEREGMRVVGLVGAGNNGGDALYALAVLAQQGFSAAAVHSAAAHSGGLEAARSAGVTLMSAGGVGWRSVVAEADVVVDGILGIGGRPGLTGEAADWVEAISEAACVVAVDLPSGADPAGEVPLGDAVFADETVTFGVAKPVHLLPATEPAVGRLTVVDIGLDLGASHLPGSRSSRFRGVSAVEIGNNVSLEDERRRVEPAVERLTFDDVGRLWPVPGPSSDKYSRGVVGIVAGTPTYPGAAVLSVLGALAAGPGMVRYVGPPEVQALVHAAAPEAVTAEGRVQAWVCGSGFDPGSRAKGVAEQKHHVEEALATDLPVVVDAGALELVDRRDAPTLLTPHAGELARLLTRLDAGPDGPGEVTRDQVTAAPLAHARAAAERTGCTVLLKGSHTLVVSPDASRAVRSQADAPAWLATAGAGDVLGGLLGTLLAAGLDPLDAGALGALVHGVAADGANPGGPVRITDVARRIPKTVATLLRRSGGEWSER